MELMQVARGVLVFPARVEFRRCKKDEPLYHIHVIDVLGESWEMDGSFPFEELRNEVRNAVREF